MIMSTDPGRSITGQVAVVGSGIAGSWVAYRLAQRGVRTILVSADDVFPPISRTLSIGLVRPELTGNIARYFAEEFEELSRLVDYHEFNGMFRPGDPAARMSVGTGGGVVAAVLDAFDALGGVRVRGRVTDLVVDGDTCLGLRYQTTGDDSEPGTIGCADVVLASGGFCGLFADGVGTNSGYLLGTYARRGGALTNLEQFTRFALGNFDRKVPHYPFEYDEQFTFLRDGQPADELAGILRASQDHARDLPVFRRYWIGNLDVPHTAVRGRDSFRLGPIRGFGDSGIPASPDENALRNVHATGECGYGLLSGWAPGRPFASYLVRGRELADKLAERPGTTVTGFDPGERQPGADPLVRKTVEQSLGSFQDAGFSVEKAERFARWCEQERQRGSLDLEDVDLLVLAEAYTRSVLARTESRGFFYRPDHPETDPELDGYRTLARYRASDDQVFVEMAPPGDGSGPDRPAPAVTPRSGEVPDS
jgi:L-aspartate oxidase